MFAFLVTLGAAWHLDDLLDERAPRLRSAVAFGAGGADAARGHALLRAHRAASRARDAARAGASPVGARRARAGSALFLLLVVPHFLWRRRYYGWWLPNTFYIKSSGIGGAWAAGRVLPAARRRAVSLVGHSARLSSPAALVARAACGARCSRLRAAGHRRVLPSTWRRWAATSWACSASSCRWFRCCARAARWRCARRCSARIGARRSPLPAVVASRSALHAWHAVRRRQARARRAGPSDRGIDRPGWLRWYTDRPRRHRQLVRPATRSPTTTPPSVAPARRSTTAASARSTATASATSTSRTSRAGVATAPRPPEVRARRLHPLEAPDDHHLEPTIASATRRLLAATRRCG